MSMLGPKLFLGRLPRDWQDEDIKQLVAPYGNVQDCKVIRNAETGQSQGCGFARFDNVADADACCRVLDGQRVLAEGLGPMTVNYARGEPDRLGMPEKPSGPPARGGNRGGEFRDNNSNNNDTKIFIGGLPKDNFGEEDLRQLMEPYGVISYVKLFVDPNGGSKGAGFVAFASRESAVQAIDVLHEKHIVPPMSRALQVRFATSKQDNQNNNSYRNQDHYQPHAQYHPQPQYHQPQYHQPQPQYHQPQYQHYQQPQYQPQYQPQPRSVAPQPRHLRQGGGWTEYFAEDGRPYYHNHSTNVTQWDVPPEFAPMSGPGPAQQYQHFDQPQYAPQSGGYQQTPQRYAPY